MGFTLILLIAQMTVYLFPQEIIMQAVLVHAGSANILQEKTGITVHPGDSLYLEITSSIPSQVEFFKTTAPVNVSIVEGNTIIFHERYTGVNAFNKAHIVKVNAHSFKPIRKLIFNFESQQGLRDIVIPIH
ncbi:hypothetical protein [Pseudochryseolinea flava]|uniref:Uncharacterized protein n=1 Tax=Pseudochryseolinea flava TaxID=2059302 RepID=A0A364XWJ3_9BACT|nr:hypothetical protein [Pseudochryseolinea flava]RAV98739.1 hypothetical protein DQQ10_22240 [Pseudochryseolinea flava]